MASSFERYHRRTGGSYVQYSKGRYSRATTRNSSKYKNNITMGKMFRTKAGRYGCYVYINGIRSHFEEKRYASPVKNSKYRGSVNYNARR